MCRLFFDGQFFLAYITDLIYFYENKPKYLTETQRTLGPVKIKQSSLKGPF